MLSRTRQGRAEAVCRYRAPDQCALPKGIEETVIRRYQEELRASQLPGYVSSYDDFDDDLSGSSSRRRQPKPAGKTSLKHVKGEQTKVELGGREPRPPHKTSSQQSAERPSSEDPDRGGFGAGIF